MAKKPFFLFDKNAAEGCVPNRELFACATGLAGQNINYSFVTGWLFYFCNNILKIDAEKVGLITSISRVWDSVNDPLIGGFIDKRRCKSGEKLRPYLLKTPLLIGLFSTVIFFDFGLSQTAALFFVLVAYLLWDMFYSVQDVALWGMVPMSSPLSHERARVSQWVSIGAGAGSAIAGIFPLIKDVMIGSMGMKESTVFAVWAVIFAFGGEVLSMSAYKMKERVHSEAPKESIFDAIFMLRHNKTLILISLARFFSSVTLTVPWPYFFESQVSYTIGSTVINGGTAQFVYGLLVGIPGALCLFATTKFADKVGGMKRLLIVAQISKIVSRIAAYLIGFNTLPKLLLGMLIVAISNIPEYMMDIAHRSLTSDSIDFVEWKTGKRTEGISFSIQNFITKIASAATLYINGKLLDILRYDQYKPMTEQNPTFMKWQWPMFILGPITGSLAYLLFISLINDKKDDKLRIELELKKRRKEFEQEKQSV